jgi:hypothetical protein
LKLGTENRNKTYAALGLGVLALIMVIYRISNPAGTSSSASAVNAVSSNPGATGPSTAPATSRRTAGTTRTTSRKPVTGPSIDPTLQLALLRASEDIKYTGKGRNIFQAQIDIPKPIKNPVIETQKTPQPPPGPPPPPPINLKFFGFASKPGEPKRIFLSQGEDVFIAGEGDIVNRRYKVVHIGPASVEIEDVLNNNRQSIPLTQG